MTSMPPGRDLSPIQTKPLENWSQPHLEMLKEGIR